MYTSQIQASLSSFLATTLYLTVQLAYPVIAAPSNTPSLSLRQDMLDVAFYPNSDCDRGNEGATPFWFEIENEKCTSTGALPFTPSGLQFSGQAPCTVELYESSSCDEGKGKTATIQSEGGQCQPAPDFIPTAYITSCA